MESNDINQEFIKLVYDRNINKLKEIYDKEKITPKTIKKSFIDSCLLTKILCDHNGCEYRYSNLELAQWLYTLTPIEIGINFRKICKNSNLELIKWVYYLEDYPDLMISIIIEDAIKNDDLKLIKLLLSKENNNIPINFELACKHSSMELIIYLKQFSIFKSD